MTLPRIQGSRASALASALLVALVLATLSSSLVGGKVFSSGDNILVWPPFSVERPAGWVRPANGELTDPVQGFVPDLLLTRADLSNGVLPLWNPFVAGGHPLLAAQVHAPLFPLTWLAFLLPFWSSLAWIAAAKLLLTAAGTFLFCRELRLRRGPSLLAAITYAFCSYYVVWLEHPQTNVWAMLPWMLLATRRICTNGSLGATALLGATSGLAWLGGHPESAAFQLAAAAVYGAFELGAEHFRGPSGEARAGPCPAVSIRARAGLLAVGLGLGAGVSAIVNAPLVELLGQSGKTERGVAPYPFNTLWTYFFPELWGSPSKLFTGIGPLNYNERTAYIGALPLLLAVGTLGRRRPREQWFFIVTSVVMLATVLDVPLWAKGVRDLPGGMVAQLGRLLILVSFAAAVLAAYGLQRWLEGSPRERRQMLAIMGTAAVIPALAWLPRHLGMLSHLGSALGQLPSTHYGETSAAVVALGSVWRWVLICGLGLGGLALSRKRTSPAFAVALVVVLTGVDLVALDRGYHGSIPKAEADPPVPSTVRYLQAHEGHARILASEYALPANLPERYGLRDARIAIDLPYPLRYTQLWSGLGGIGGDQGFYNPATPGAHRLADIFAVRYVLLQPGLSVPWLHPVLSNAAGTVAVNPTALPRAWVAYDWRSSSLRTAALSSTLASSTGQLKSRPLIEGAPRPPAGVAPAPTTATVTEDGNETVTLRADAARAGYLILDDSAYPGWDATLDGLSVRWLPANEDFRAVAIPAGRHVISFHYDPGSFLLGAIVTALSLLALVMIAVGGAVSVRRRRGPSVTADLDRVGEVDRAATGVRGADDQRAVGVKVEQVAP
jgi:hypothetical protein